MKLHFKTSQLKQQEFAKTRHVLVFPKKHKAGIGCPRKTPGSSSEEFQMSMKRVRNTRERRQQRHTRYKEVQDVNQ